jgi:hypothetical protein
MHQATMTWNSIGARMTTITPYRISAAAIYVIRRELGFLNVSDCTPNSTAFQSGFRVTNSLSTV